MRKTNDEEIIAMLKAGMLQKDIAADQGVSPAAISKRIKRLLPPPESLEKLTEKEQRFALEVARGRTQTQAALNSFEVS
jgi:predicted transcriptional regulator